jgi:hypothetical protein
MVHGTANAGRFPSGSRISLSGTIALSLAASALAAGAAAWMTDFNSAASASNPASPKEARELSFDARFTAGSAFDSLPVSASPRPLVRSFYSEVEAKLQEAKGRLARKLQSEDWKTALLDESAPPPSTALTPPAPAPVSNVAAVPLPKSRPVEANSEVPADPPPVQADNRSILQKLADALPAKMTLASLAPDGGLSSDGPDLASLGYDGLTAVYDISAHAVYMPNHLKLEAHSGIGPLMDDPEHVSERNVGATPPAIYDLRPRERLFHGVPALRMIPVDSSATLGRSGLLAHSYMLGPNGDSNGCVSIKNYERFLKAYQDGEIKRLVVVPSLGDSATASRRSTSQS